MSAPEQQWIRNTGKRVYIHVYIHMIIYWKSVCMLFPRSLKASWLAKHSGPMWEGGRRKSLMLLVSNNKSWSYLPPCLIKYLEKKTLWLIHLLIDPTSIVLPFCCPSWVNTKWWLTCWNKLLATTRAETKCVMLKVPVEFSIHATNRWAVCCMYLYRMYYLLLTHKFQFIIIQSLI